MNSLKKNRLFTFHLRILVAQYLWSWGKVRSLRLDFAMISTLSGMGATAPSAGVAGSSLPHALRTSAARMAEMAVLARMAGTTMCLICDLSGIGSCWLGPRRPLSATRWTTCVWSTSTPCITSILVELRSMQDRTKKPAAGCGRHPDPPSRPAIPTKAEVACRLLSALACPISA